ncbi:ubiquitin carboxyl-terminal hydrolase 26-like [Hyperolius riggenbachi]|uniref:ubiquitin carboxyl-terminal hydrolase 26-like n=1 Tax=Hyperolius riggenbachi TaxID=752182 RepID=UPI0035A3D12D
MASLCLRGSIRIHCMKKGTSKWKEGVCELVEKDKKYSLVVTFNAGGDPTTFPLHQNVKTVVLRPSADKLSRLMVTLKDGGSVMIDKVQSKDAEELKNVLDAISTEKAQTVNLSQGSASFGGVLGNRTAQVRPLMNMQTQEVELLHTAKVEENFSRKERVFLATTMLQSNYDTLRDVFQKRRIVESLAQELWERFRRRHLISQIQRRWSDMKRREQRFLRHVRDRHVLNAQIPPQRHRARRRHESSESEESQDHPPPPDTDDQLDPPGQAEEEGPPLLQPEAPLPQEPLHENVELPPQPQEPQAAPPQRQRGKRRARVDAILGQIVSLLGPLQEAVHDWAQN